MREQQPGEWRQFDNIRVRVVPPDTLFVESQGDVGPADVYQLRDEIVRLAATCGRIFLLDDIRKVKTISPGARKAATQLRLDAQLRGVIFLGASFHQQVLLKMVIQGAKVFYTRAVAVPVCFCASEAEGYALIERLRSTPGPA